MFLALRELRFAKSRFGLMGAVIVLIAILMVLLSGLSQGLVKDGVSGLQALPATSFAFEKNVQTDSAFTRSVVDTHAVEDWSAQPGVTDAAPFGLALVNGANQDGTQVDLSLIGVEADSFVAPSAAEGEGLVDANSVVLSATAKDLGMAIGDVITLERTHIELTVTGFLDGQHTFGHVNMGYADLSTWQSANAGLPLDVALPDGKADEFTAVAVKSDLGADALAAADEEAGTTSTTLEESYAASPGYSAETSTLMLIQVFLYAICALVAGAFFTVLTIHRKPEIAVMRAMGASTGYLLRDGLGQALILLLVSVGLGVAIGWSGGALLQTTAMPFALVAGPIALAALLLIVLGLLGATTAIVRIARVDPLTALGANR